MSEQAFQAQLSTQPGSPAQLKADDTVAGDTRPGASIGRTVTKPVQQWWQARNDRIAREAAQFKEDVAALDATSRNDEYSKQYIQILYRFPGISHAVLLIFNSPPPEGINLWGIPRASDQDRR
ncbi:MAG TPA: hypothetical protein VKG45_13885 [Actinomycetes bacterium]|nr:hypothetical protein [Actinomycetes bacterium]